MKVFVRVTPRSSRDYVDGITALADGRLVLRIRIRAVPEGGRANEATIVVLADMLHVPRSKVRLVEGASARIKTIHIEGDAARIHAVLQAVVQERSPL